MTFFARLADALCVAIAFVLFTVLSILAGDEEAWE